MITDVFTFTPFVRFHTQSASDYFAGFEEHLSSEEFYTSDFDLSQLKSFKYGLGLSYAPIYGVGRAKLFKKILMLKFYFWQAIYFETLQLQFLKMESMRFDIIGAGIGGLTTAIALNKKNIDCQVFEQANNAMQVYDNLGLRNQIEEVGNPISSMQITNSQLETLSTIDLREFEQKYGVKNIAIHRAKLHQVLVSNLQEDVVLDHALEDISYTNSGFTLHFKDQDQVKHTRIHSVRHGDLAIDLAL